MARSGRRLPVDFASRCPNRAEHTVFPDDPEPTSYMGWDYWAQRRSKTHVQVRHEPCGLYTIWVPKDSPAGKAELNQRRRLGGRPAGGQDGKARRQRAAEEADHAAGPATE